MSAFRVWRASRLRRGCSRPCAWTHSYVGVAAWSLDFSRCRSQRTTIPPPVTSAAISPHEAVLWGRKIWCNSSTVPFRAVRMNMKAAVFLAGQRVKPSRQGRQSSQARTPNSQACTILSTPGGCRGKGDEGSSAPVAVVTWIAAMNPSAIAQRRAFCEFTVFVLREEAGGRPPQPRPESEDRLSLRPLETCSPADYRERTRPAPCRRHSCRRGL